MIGTARRDAAFPGEPFTFEVSPDPDISEADVGWTGGGSPATGTGSNFTTSFPSGGTFVVTARRGEAEIDFRVTVCPIDEWMLRARTFYGSSIDFSMVKVSASWLVLGAPGTAWTCNDVIRFKRPRRLQELPQESTLIHELGHVWQHQTGQAQLLKGLAEQIGKLLGRDPYDFDGPSGVRAAPTLISFTKEGQAQIAMEYWRAQHGYETDLKGVQFSTAGYLEDLRRLVQGAGIGMGSAPRRTITGRIDAAIGRIVNGVVDRLG